MKHYPFTKVRYQNICVADILRPKALENCWHFQESWKCAFHWRNRALETADYQTPDRAEVVPHMLFENGILRVGVWEMEATNGLWLSGCWEGYLTDQGVWLMRSTAEKLCEVCLTWRHSEFICLQFIYVTTSARSGAYLSAIFWCCKNSLEFTSGLRLKTPGLEMCLTHLARSNFCTLWLGFKIRPLDIKHFSISHRKTWRMQNGGMRALKRVTLTGSPPTSTMRVSWVWPIQ